MLKTIAPKNWGFIILVSLLTLAFLYSYLFLHFYNPHLPLRFYVYRIIREGARALALSTAGPEEGYLTLRSDPFVVRYQLEDREAASLVLEVAHEVYGLVARDLGFKPTSTVDIILHPDREAMRNSFGWAQGENALGAYHRGVIRILSPRAWIDEDKPELIAKVFRYTGPTVHELTHLVLDYATSGNYPYWFSEGLAQYEEYRLTGFVWVEPESNLKQPLYTLEELEEQFVRLPNQSLAYRQAFTLVCFLAESYGDEALRQLVARLGEGKPMPEALQLVTGIDYGDLELRWLEWLEEQGYR